MAAIRLTAIGQMFVILACPLWSLLIIAVDAVALWGLCAHGSRENVGAAEHRSPRDGYQLNGADAPRIPRNLAQAP